MSNAFDGRTTFNEDIGKWDVSNVTRMYEMFSNMHLPSMRTSATGMFLQSLICTEFFRKAVSFNQDISDWMYLILKFLPLPLKVPLPLIRILAIGILQESLKWGLFFKVLDLFNQDIGDWNTSKVEAMWTTFSNAASFNQDISRWDTSSVTRMHHMFQHAVSFNQDLSDWNISAVTDMNRTFYGTINLAAPNKGKVHESFASNPNWAYDWRQYVEINNSNFQPAVNLWFDNQAEANATYGHISDWNVSAVTDMANAFIDQNYI